MLPGVGRVAGLVNPAKPATAQITLCAKWKGPAAPWDYCPLMDALWTPKSRRLNPASRNKVMGAIALCWRCASLRHVQRVMGENGLLAPHRVGRAESKPHDGTIATTQS